MAFQFGGWIHRPAEVEAFLARLPNPTFAQAAPHLLYGEHQDWLAWEQGEMQLFGRTLPAHAQTIGDCVSHGFARGVQDQLYIDQAQTRPKGVYAAEEPIQIATEPVYALSRVEIGKGRIGNGDGSVGAWAAEAVQQYGVLPRKAYGQYDLSKYRPDLAKSWGRPKAGLPNELEPEAKTHVVQYVAQVTTSDEAKAAARNGYVIPVCSNQGFVQKRDANGICKPSGQWAHCLLMRSICLLKGNRLCAGIQQSWGNDPTGPDEVQLESGRTIKLPMGVFLIDWEVFVKMLRAGDSFAVSGPSGFEARKPIAWNVFHQV